MKKQMKKKKDPKGAGGEINPFRGKYILQL